MMVAAYSRPMSVNRAVHTANLQALVDSHEGIKALAAAIARGVRAPEKPIDSTQISNALKGRRYFGEKVHRKIERALGLPPLWFEQEHPTNGNGEGAIGKQLSEAALWFARAFDHLNQEHQKSIVSYFKIAAPESFAEMPDSIRQLSGESGDGQGSKLVARPSDRKTRGVSKSQP